VKSIIVIPTYDRPEMLWLCLEMIARADKPDDYHIWVCQDNHLGKPIPFATEVEYVAVLSYFKGVFGSEHFTHVSTPVHDYYGNSYNVLRNIGLTLLVPYVRTVYLIEDDSMVTPDFFRFNEVAQEKFRPFVVCNGRINRSLNFHINGPDAIDESQPDPSVVVRSAKAYMSWANSFDIEALEGLFDTTPISYAEFRPGYEQDMFFQNVIRMKKLDSIWPVVPRAYHLGWYSYHRSGQRPNGTLEERVKFLRQAITDKNTLQQLAGLQDMDPYPLHIPKWDGEVHLR
jgi:hypothetical protein